MHHPIKYEQCQYAVGITMPTLPTRKLRYLVGSLVWVESGKMEIPAQIGLISKVLFLTTKEGRTMWVEGEEKSVILPVYE